MKHILLLFFVNIILLNSIRAQSGTNHYPFININGIPLTATKAAVIKVLGNPKKIYRPHYDCGFFSENQEHPYYLLDYANVKWIGNDKEGYYAEDIYLTQSSPYHLTFKGHTLSANTTIQEFMRLSGIKKFIAGKAGDSPDDLRKFTHNPKLAIQTIDFLPKTGDSKYIFYFTNNKLLKIELWTPC